MNNRMTIALCLLTWNEAEGCRMDVPRIPMDEFDEVFAVDGGSDDGTVEYLTGVGIRVMKQPRPSLNAACAYAYELSNSDAVVFFHPKGTVPPEDLKSFRPLFQQGYELIIGSRNAPGGTNEEDSRVLKPRKWFVLSLSTLLSGLWRRDGEKIRDVLHGFRGMTAHAFEIISPTPSGVTIDAEMVTGAYRHRIPRIEFPTSEQARRHGTTHFSALPTGWRILQYIVRTLFEGADPSRAVRTSPPQEP